MSRVVCVVAVCHIEVPDSLFDVKYAPYFTITEGVPVFDEKFAIDYLFEKYNYPAGTIIKVHHLIPLNSFDDYTKYIG